MTLSLEQILCKDFGSLWTDKVNSNSRNLENYINALESSQTTATSLVAAEVGAARSGFLSLADRLANMVAKNDEIAARISSLILGKTADLYDPATSYVKNDFIIYDGQIYVCLSADLVSGVLPTDKTKFQLLMGYEKVAKPALAGPLTANEGTVVNVSLGTGFDAETDYHPSVSGGTLSALMVFPDDESYAGQHGWKWTLPTLDVTAPHKIDCYATKDGYALSDVAAHFVSVVDVPISQGTAFAVPDTPEGWNGATVETGNIFAPAYSVPGDNPYQLASGVIKFTQASGELTVLDPCGVGTAEAPLKLAAAVEVGTVLIAETSAGTEETVVQSVVSNGEADYSAVVLPVLSGIPTKVFKKEAVLLALGAGVIGEYLGSEIALTLDAENSNTSELKVTSANSILDKIFIIGGKHNNLKCDGVVVAVASVSEQITPGTPVNILPIMTAATTEGVTFSASAGESGYPDVNPAWYAGDGSAATRWQTDATLPQQLSIALASGLIVSGVALTCGSGSTDTSRMAKNFAIEGRITDGSWSVLKNVTDATGWNSGERREFLVDVPTNCDEVRVNVSSNNGDSYLGIADFEVLSAPDAYVTTVNLVEPLAEIPAAVAIPDRCTLIPAALAALIVNGELKITADSITLADDPDIKRLVVAVKGPAEYKFNGVTIDIMEKK